MEINRIAYLLANLHDNFQFTRVTLKIWKREPDKSIAIKSFAFHGFISMNGICEYLILKIFFRNGICVSTNGIIPSVLLFCVYTNLFFCKNYAKCATQKLFNVKRMIIVCTQRSSRRKNRTFVSHN
ncbi:hypothetical protein C0T31_04740 [Dysgonamonadaceae bacterium]|nr:hypothetical protein C0T31_04740 [Dysgonamonadaceae bacterium]